MAKNDNLRPAGPLFLRQKRPAQSRRHPEQVEKVRRHLGAGRAFRLLVTDRQVAGYVLDCAEVDEGLGLIAIGGEFAAAMLELGRGIRALLLVKLHDSGMITVGKRIEEERANDAEDGGVHPDGQGKSDNGQGSERGRLHELPKGVAEIIHRWRLEGWFFRSLVTCRESFGA
jgi:hypothetical protein